MANTIVRHRRQGVREHQVGLAVLVGKCDKYRGLETRTPGRLPQCCLFEAVPGG